VRSSPRHGKGSQSGPMAALVPMPADQRPGWPVTGMTGPRCFA